MPGRVALFAIAPLAISLLVACGGRAAAPPAPAPTPVPAPVTVAPRVSRFTVPATVPSTGYSVRIRTELQRDSAGRTERDNVESTARVTMSLRRDARGGLRSTGRVDSFTVKGNGPTFRSSDLRNTRTTVVAAPQFTSVTFDAVLDSLLVRSSVRPALANECDRPEAAAAAIARDLLVRVPAAVSLGDRWRDSVVTLVCRGGVPMTVRIVIESEAAALRDGDRTLELRRTLATSVQGSSRTPWRQTDITGTGQGTQTAMIDLASGALAAIDGESTLTLRVTSGGGRDGTRMEQVVQRSVLAVRSDRR